MPPASIRHVHISSGHVRESPRSEVDDGVVRILAPLLARVVAGEEVDAPATGGTTLTGAVGGDCVITAVWAPNGAPICTIGVARGPEEADRLWALLHTTAVGIEPVTPADSPPAAPWCAARLEVGIATDLEAAQWLGDFERCWAWTWIESRGPSIRVRLAHPRQPTRRPDRTRGHVPKPRRRN